MILAACLLIECGVLQQQTIMGKSLHDKVLSYGGEYRVRKHLVLFLRSGKFGFFFLIFKEQVNNKISQIIFKILFILIIFNNYLDFKINIVKSWRIVYI